MRALAALASLAVTLALPETGRAQDFVGFDRASFGRVVLNRTESAGLGDIELELSVGDYNNEPIQTYSPTSIFRKMGLSVGRLDILTDAGVFPCTAFIVDEKHLLTNHHCVPGILENERAKATRIDSVMFVAGYIQQGVEEGTRRYTVIPTPVEASKELDYAVLEVIGDPSAEFGQLRLASALPHDNDPYLVIGHPMGEAQRISREKCRANAPAVSNQRLLHTCDTLPGNSGSPVIDAGLQMVVGLHHAGSKRDAVNFAIPMAAILERSQVLKAALADEPRRDPPPDPSRDPAPEGDAAEDAEAVDPAIEAARLCDALYAEAKAFGQCFAYEAYLEGCGAHSYAVFARSYVAAECAGVPDGAPIDPPPGHDEVVDQSPLRPWCRAAALNSAERTICGDAYLAGLDGELDRAYRAQTGISSAAEQSDWRTGTRDACGSDAGCLGRAMIDRIAYLKSPAAPQADPQPAGGYRIRHGSYTLHDGSCYIITASRPSVEAAIAFARDWFPRRSGVRIFGSDNGYYGVVIGTTARSGAEARIASLVSSGQVPSDSYCSTGSRYVSEVLRQGGSGSGSGAAPTRMMYVDNNSAGGLNVRRGPGTQFSDFTELAPGTRVTVLRDQGDWSEIRMPDGANGWVYRPLLTSSKPRVRACTARVVNLQPYSFTTRETGTGFLNIRADDSARARILSEAYLGDHLKVLAQKGNWARVSCLSGQCAAPYRGSAGAIGWASRKYLSIQCQ